MPHTATPDTAVRVEGGLFGEFPAGTTEDTVGTEGSIPAIEVD